jgi:hypothetical protein
MNLKRIGSLMWNRKDMTLIIPRILIDSGRPTSSKSLNRSRTQTYPPLYPRKRPTSSSLSRCHTQTYLLLYPRSNVIANAASIDDPIISPTHLPLFIKMTNVNYLFNYCKIFHIIWDDHFLTTYGT